MKQSLLLFFILLIVTFSSLAQGPPPCTLSGHYVCDDDLDGVATANLELFFPVINCAGVIFENYENLFFLTEEDQINNTNPISNPESFEITTESVEIFIRSRNLDTDNVQLRNKILQVVIPPTPATPTPLYSCDFNNDGFAEFFLGAKTNEIRSSQEGSYMISYHQTFEDAQNLENPLDTPSSAYYTNVTAFQQTIYASMAAYGNLAIPASASCVEVVPLELIATQDCEDLQVNLFNQSESPMPGFDFENVLTIENAASATIASGTVTYTLDSNIILNSVTSSDPSLNIVVTADGFTVDFNSIEAHYNAIITIDLTCPETVPLGTLITNTAIYSTNTNDQNHDNDISVLTQQVVGSYDPNDIMESHGPQILYDDFVDSDEFLFYTIRFQNIGTAEAINVRIENILNDQLDESSFQMIRSSHGVSTLRTADMVEWNFENINLPAEQDDAEGSKGYVYFKIKPMAGYDVGDVIPNFAAIYFDFNAPIITNTFTTTFVETLSVTKFSETSFGMYPNPASNKVTIQLNGTIENSNVEIFDIQGKKVFNSIITNVLEINTSELSSGIYFVKLITNEKSEVKKLMID